MRRVGSAVSASRPPIVIDAALDAIEEEARETDQEARQEQDHDHDHEPGDRTEDGQSDVARESTNRFPSMCSPQGRV